MKNLDIKKLSFDIFLTFIIGVLPSIFVFKNINTVYANLNKPPLSPPGFIFPIAWSILYILMGISLYIIDEDDSKYKKQAKLLYYIQLFINALWTPIFFGLKYYFLAFTWILILIIIVIYMISIFYKINKLSSFLQFSYLFWLIFASYLNFYIFVLN